MCLADRVAKLQAQVEEHKQDTEMQKLYDEQSKRERAEAEKLLIQLRADMRLPALPKQK
jgi:hypothetical protein